MNAFFSFGYPNPQERMKGYSPEVKLYYLHSLESPYLKERNKEIALFIMVWFMRLYWLVMVAWFFFQEQNTGLLVLNIPLLISSLVMVYALGLIARSESFLHIFFAVQGIIVASLSV